MTSGNAQNHASSSLQPQVSSLTNREHRLVATLRNPVLWGQSYLRNRDKTPRAKDWYGPLAFETRYVCGYNGGWWANLITSFRHKGLKRFFLTGHASGVAAKHASRLRLLLSLLAAASSVQDMNFPGSGLHPLKGKGKGRWAVNVSGNWRLTFRFEEGEASEVDYEDYH